MSNFGKSDFSEFNVYEKYGWLEEMLGDYASLDLIFQGLHEGGNALESLVGFFSSDDDYPATDDLITWFLEGNTAFEALEYLVTNEYLVECVIDRLVSEHGVEIVDYDADGFSSNAEWLAWRNR